MANVKIGVVLLLILIVCGFNVSAQESLWIDDLGICNETLIEVPVSFYNDNTVLTDFSVTVTFDALTLAFANISTSDPTTDWDILSCTESPSGVLNIQGSAGSGTSISAYTEDVLFNLSFQCPGCTTSSYTDFNISNLAGDLTSFSFSNGSFTWYENCGISISNETSCHEPVSFLLSLSNTNPIDSLYATIDYDPEMLLFTGSSRVDLTGDWTFITAYEVTGNEGTVIVTGSTDYGGSTIPASSSGDIIELTFDVTCASCTEDQSSGLIISNTDENLFGYTTTDGSFTYHCGTPDPPAIIVEDTSHYGYVSVPVILADTPNEVDAFLFNLTYDETMLTYVNCSRGDLTEGFEEVNGNITSTGIVTIAGYDPTPVPTGSSGTLLFVNFDVTCSTCSQGDSCEIALENLQDDLLHWESQNGTFTYQEPPPLPATGIWGVTVLLIIFSGLCLIQRKH